MQQLRVVVCVMLTLFVGQRAFAQNANDTTIEARKQLRAAQEKRDIDTLARLQVEELSTRCKATASQLEKLSQASTALSKRMEALLTNEDGKRLAGNDMAFFSFIDYQEHTIVNPNELEHRVTAVKALLSDLDQSLKSPAVGYVPDVQRKLETDAAYAWALDKLSQVNQATNWLESAVSKSPAAKPDARTLRDSIQSYRDKRLADLYAARAAGWDAAKEPSKQIIMEQARTAEIEKAAALAQREKKEVQQELERLKIEQDRQLQEARLANQEQVVRAQIESERKQADLQKELDDALLEVKKKKVTEEIKHAQVDESIEHTRLVAKCQTPELRQQLAPFLTEGRWQPGERRRSFDHKPMSLNALKSYGALQPTQEGLLRFASCCATNFTGDSNNARQDTDRPKIKVSDRRPDHWTRQEIDKFKELQGLLIELGPTLVELKMLDQ